MNVFVAGTGTDVGKTTVAAWLCLHAKADYWKPVQTGSRLGRDAETVARLTDARCLPEAVLLPEPLSPYEAASLAGVRIEPNAIRLPGTDRPLVVEGAGGLLVPLNGTTLLVDLIARLGLPVILAAHSSLGTINHTCLSLEALRARDIPTLGVILSGEPNPANREAIERFGRTAVLAELPWLDPLDRAGLARIKPSAECLTWRMPRS
jgi:dethiobiotin synthase